MRDIPMVVIFGVGRDNKLLGMLTRAFLRHAVRWWYDIMCSVYKEKATFVWKSCLHMTLLKFREAVVRKCASIRRHYIHRVYVRRSPRSSPRRSATDTHLSPRLCYIMLSCARSTRRRRPSSFVWKSCLHMTLLKFREAVVRKCASIRRHYIHRVYTPLTEVVPEEERDRYAPLATIRLDGSYSLTAAFRLAVTQAET